MSEGSRCDFYEVCTTPNLWVDEKKNFINEVCETKEHGNCVHYASLSAHFESGMVDKDEEWERIKDYFKEVKEGKHILMKYPGNFP